MIGILNSVANCSSVLYSAPNTAGQCVSSGTAITENQGSFLGLASIAEIVVEVLALGIMVALVGVLVIIVVANRADPDPSGRRPQSVYFFAVSFITLTTSIIGSAVVVSAPLRLIGTHSGPIADSIARTVVLGGLITVVSVFLLVIHLTRGVALAQADTQAASPSRRVGQSYVSAVAFVAILVLLVLTVLTVYLIFSIAGPGVFGSVGGRSSAVRVLIEAVYLGVVAGVVLWTHANLVPPGLRIFNLISRPGRPGPGQSTSALIPPTESS